MQVFNLYFGRSVRPGGVTDRNGGTSAIEVIPRHSPTAIPLLDGQGAWLNPRLCRPSPKTTKILVVAMPDAPDSLTAINGIRGIWQHRFHQYVVGMTVQSGCGSFSPAEASPDPYAQHDVATHYGTAGLLDRILEALARAEKDIDQLTIGDLGLVDEFHSRRRRATEELAGCWPRLPTDHVSTSGQGSAGRRAILRRPMAAGSAASI